MIQWFFLFGFTSSGFGVTKTISPRNYSTFAVNILQLSESISKIVILYNKYPQFCAFALVFLSIF